MRRRRTFTLRTAGTPAAFLSDFRQYYGPTMNAFAAAEQSGRADDLQRELVTLFEQQNRSGSAHPTVIPATFLKISVDV